MASKAVYSLVWSDLIKAESRSIYFGYIATRLQRRERIAAFLVAFLSSVAFLNLVSKSGVPGLSEAFSLLSAIAGIYVGLSKQTKTAALASSLCRTWEEVQDDLQELWLQSGKIHDDGVLARWREIQGKHYIADKSAHALTPNPRLMRESQARVFNERGIKVHDRTNAPGSAPVDTTG